MRKVWLVGMVLGLLGLGCTENNTPQDAGVASGSSGGGASSSSRPRSSSAASPSGTASSVDGRCNDTCPFALDGVCDSSPLCAPGTDCTDCYPQASSRRAEASSSAAAAFSASVEEASSSAVARSSSLAEQSSSLAALSSSGAPPTSRPEPYGGSATCSDTCLFANNGTCDDGAPGLTPPSQDPNVTCAGGTDCTDCGFRWCGNSCPGHTGNGVCEDEDPDGGIPPCGYATDCADCGVRPPLVEPCAAPDVPPDGGMFRGLGIRVVCSDSCARARNGRCEDPSLSSSNHGCAAGTDCTDCGPLFVTECINTCETAGNMLCEDPSTGDGSCPLGTDCTDCGPHPTPGALPSSSDGVDTEVTRWDPNGTFDPTVLPLWVEDASTSLAWELEASPDDLTWAEANDHCASLSLGSHQDWRLPSRAELFSLNRANYLEGTFPDWPYEPLWSGTLVGTVPYQALFVDFSNFYGATASALLVSRMRVRCVRVVAPVAPVPQPRFQVMEGYVLDQATGLSWLSQAIPYVPGTSPFQTCSDVTLDGRYWSPPTLAELVSLVDVRRDTPALDGTAFPDDGPGLYVTTTLDLWMRRGGTTRALPECASVPALLRCMAYP